MPCLSDHLQLWSHQAPLSRVRKLLEQLLPLLETKRRQETCSSHCLAWSPSICIYVIIRSVHVQSQKTCETGLAHCCQLLLWLGRCSVNHCKNSYHACKLLHCTYYCTSIGTEIHGMLVELWTNWAARNVNDFTVTIQCISMTNESHWVSLIALSHTFSPIERTWTSFEEAWEMNKIT